MSLSIIRGILLFLFLLPIFLYAVQKCLCPIAGSESLFPKLVYANLASLISILVELRTSRTLS